MSEGSVLRGWFQGLDDGRLRLPRCSHCGHWNWYPLPRCRSCSGAEMEWVSVPPDGRIYSWTRVHRAFGEPVAELPYVTGIVDIAAAPGVRLVCLQSRPACDPEIGQPVRIALERTAKGNRWTFSTITT